MLISAHNFAQPHWLWALLLIPLAWGLNFYWRKYGRINFSSLNKFIDQSLLQHVLMQGETGNKRNQVGILYSLLVFCLVMALANPRWNYIDIEAFQPTASMVILLDLSTTMNATDVSPSRIIRARQSIEDLLNLSKGLKIGLIGFAGYPHLISPITDDIQTIKTYIPALDTDLTNVQGNSLPASLRMASELLAHEPGDKKSIVLVSDGNVAADNYTQELHLLNKQNVQVHVIGVGTANGAPYKTRSGNIQKSHGKVAVSKLNITLLKNIAQMGHGIYTEAGLSDVGLRVILKKAQATEQEHIVAGKVRQWQDRYYLFLIPAAALLLYLMRQRILYMWVLGILGAGMVSSDAYAFEAVNLFLNSEQKGQQIYTDGDFNKAAETFKDPYHKGVALYRAGQYAEAEQAFAQVQRTSVKLDAMYNTGNAQMQQRKWRAAIKSYESVLSVDPENFAAQHNLELARKMLAENHEPEEEQDDCECNNKKNESAQNNSDDLKTQAQEEQGQNQQQQDAAAQDFTAQHDADKEQQDVTQTPVPAVTQLSEDDARIEQWLNRVDSDIKVFLKNKFYVEDVIGAQ